MPNLADAQRAIASHQPCRLDACIPAELLLLKALLSVAFSKRYTRKERHLATSNVLFSGSDARSY